VLKGELGFSRGPSIVRQAIAVHSVNCLIQTLLIVGVRINARRTAGGGSGGGLKAFLYSVVIEFSSNVSRTLAVRITNSLNLFLSL
jgi:hypothetical protein